jgi:adenosine deaminase
MEQNLRRLIDKLPKTELHVHIEGTLEPELLLELAVRNGYELPFEDVDAAHAAYRFTDLQSFLDIYYQGAAVLRTPRDFYDLMSAYLRRAAADGVRHAEIFFDPQTHTHRGVGFPVFMEGFRSAIADARRQTGITADLILCFLRHLSGEDALATLYEAEPHLEGVIAVGLDSSEQGRPPEWFEVAYSRARDLGLRAVAHAGEEGPPEYITTALDVLGVERIDHGVRCLEDPEVVRRLSSAGIPLTVCPMSNVALKVVDRIEDHPLPELIAAGIRVTVNSDDPAYFGGYVGDNYQALAEGLGLGPAELIALARNSIEASFLADGRKVELVAELEAITGDFSPQRTE